MYMGFLEEGDSCTEKGCPGRLDFPSPDNCSCHISPPCSACTSVVLTCHECGWEDEPQEFNDVQVAPGLSVRTMRPKPLDTTKIDYRVKMHSASSQLCEGVYPEGTSATEVREMVEGTFGGHFSQFGKGKFKFIAYTD